jgi:hypothetical protein
MQQTRSLRLVSSANIVVFRFYQELISERNLLTHIGQTSGEHSLHMQILIVQVHLMINI